MTIIGISGKKHSGKNTFATMLREYVLCDSEELSIASELKQEVADWCKVSLKDIEDNKSKFRAILQAIGSYRRQDNEYYWIEKLLKKVKDSNKMLVVITDVRYKNEANILKEIGAMLIRIDRPSLPADDNHASETDLDRFQFDRYITNDGSLGQLKFTAQQLAEQLNNL